MLDKKSFFIGVAIGTISALSTLKLMTRKRTVWQRIMAVFYEK